MNKHESKGAFDKLQGETKRTLGKLSGNESLEAEGNIDKGKGHAEEKLGHAKEKLSSKFNDHADRMR
ncbi:general stress protein CsbD [Bacillus sp. FJAT-18017]|uniref:CsbD family protein n=1 Tax=Bacillus sp. FJAT-18017 TaxID=1705566 RepID=UPI0006AF7626|nr:CsbD family protein [Bacillus sp. FJAT-18017]ALC90817.1 general stress protein CsbD [Bacillus sp. FJAT-18017]